MSGIQDTYLNTGYDSREKRIKLKPDDNHKIISIVGLTGSGKSTLLRKILGTETEEIPPVSANRTTTYNFEAVISDNNIYKFCITIHPTAYLEEIVIECLYKATKIFHDKNNIDRAFRSLLEDSTQTFRLSYIIGDIDNGKQHEIKNKYVNALHGCAKIYSQLYNILKDDKKLNSIELYDNDAIIYEDLIKSDIFKSSKDDILKDILNTLKNVVDNNKIKRVESQDSQISFYFESESRKDFIANLQPFIGIEKSSWGKLITPLVESVRIAGPFHASWLNTFPKVTFVDGKGIGHTQQNQSISYSHIQLFELSDNILIIDDSEKPMQDGTVDIIKGAVKHGFHEKLLIVFSKFDRVEGPNFVTYEDKIKHIQNSFLQTCDRMTRDQEEYHIVKDLEDLPEHKFFYLSKVNSHEVDNNFINEIRKLFKYVDDKARIEINVNLQSINTINYDEDDKYNTTCFKCSSKLTNESEDTLLKRMNLTSEQKKQFSIFLGKDYSDDMRLCKNCVMEIFNRQGSGNVNSTISGSIPGKKSIDYQKELSKAVDEFCGKWDAKLNLPTSYPGQSEHWTRIKALSRRMANFS